MRVLMGFLVLFFDGVFLALFCCIFPMDSEFLEHKYFLLPSSGHSVNKDQI